jgi:hypothetical protein
MGLLHDKRNVIHAIILPLFSQVLIKVTLHGMHPSKKEDPDDDY